MRKNNLGEDLDSAFSSINKARSNKKLYLISVGQDVIFGFKVPQVKSHPLKVTQAAENCSWSRLRDIDYVTVSRVG